MSVRDDIGADNGTFTGPAVPMQPPRANLVSSQLIDSDTHMPVLDIDSWAWKSPDLWNLVRSYGGSDVVGHLVPSSTFGHFHLYLQVEIPSDEYLALLPRLADAKVIQPGYAAASIERGCTRVRYPGTWKPG